VWLSRYEMELWPALGALASVLRGELRPGDVMQVNLSSRSAVAMHLAAASCRLAGAGCRPLGIVSPEAALENLAEGGATILLTVSSYLAELVRAARRAGLGAGDFRLRRLVVGGEVLSASLARAAARTFGVPLVDDPYSMTEIVPVTGRPCSQGHMHHDLNLGHTELADLDTGEPAAPGALGTLVITPYFPYRDCTPVFRYDTRDVARRLPDTPLRCEQSITVLLAAIAVCNLYVQGGMKLRHVAWLALGLACYDVIFASYYPLTGRLLARYITHPLTPVVGMRFGEVDYVIGLGDLLVYSLFFVVAYKAYGKRAATIAAGVIVVMGGFATAFIPFLFNFSNANLDTLVPAQSLFGPAAFVTYLWMKRRYGRERTMAEYLASQDGAAIAPAVEQAPAP